MSRKKVSVAQRTERIRSKNLMKKPNGVRKEVLDRVSRRMGKKQGHG